MELTKEYATDVCGRGLLDMCPLLGFTHSGCCCLKDDPILGPPVLARMQERGSEANCEQDKVKPREDSLALRLLALALLLAIVGIIAWPTIMQFVTNR